MSKEYRVGRGKPPLGSRFKAGVSGNPSGRPKRAPTLRTEVLDELARPAPAGGKDTRQRAIVRKLVDRAIAGNLRAMSVLVAVLARTQDPEHQPVEQLSDHDREILENFAQRELRTAEESEAANQGGEEGAGMSSDRVLPGPASRDRS